MSTVPAARADGPAMTEVVDSSRGAVRVSGHLTVQGADLLRGTVETLRRGGHTRVLVDLQGVQAADAAGLHVLRDVERSLAAEGARLLVDPADGLLG
ncbi:STAS domain-containing protein [Blastococcus sp. PRF04-17]|uniref:STAS domain-containing protein n=1 Tax=Blastococcus sp. PRF04-17 TaxID=2933797 RepID=UPI001FF0F124|nr:STAS domain-containing protein [Blastococcus sp. PRF04-17]UOX99739.1 STAS domain-containing protein [Blastococcus sp. PRF04-17]